MSQHRDQRSPAPADGALSPFAPRLLRSRSSRLTWGAFVLRFRRELGSGASLPTSPRLSPLLRKRSASVATFPTEATAPNRGWKQGRGIESSKKSDLRLSEKRIHISDNRFWMKVANPIDRAMLARIKTRGEGWVFSPTDFLDLGSRDAVDKALSRMAATGTIRRVVRGLYDVPRQHPVVGMTAPSVDKVARALAGKAGTRLQPTGAYAANLLARKFHKPSRNSAWNRFAGLDLPSWC